MCVGLNFNPTNQRKYAMEINRGFVESNLKGSYQTEDNSKGCKHACLQQVNLLGFVRAVSRFVNIS